MTIAWIDLETTGLDSKKNDILEVACVVTTDNLEYVARFERVIYDERARFLAHLNTAEVVDRHHGVERLVIEMHQKNGLWRDSAAAASVTDLIVAETDLCSFLNQHAGAKPQLGGSSVHFDRAFLASQMSDVADLLHHRHVDVSVMNEMARRFWPAVYEGRPYGESAHRAMPDVLHSIATARYYRTALAPACDVRSAFLYGIEHAESGDVAQHANWGDAADKFMVEYCVKSQAAP